MIFSHMGSDLDERDIMEYNLILFNGPFIKDITGDILHGQIYAFLPGLFLDIGKQPHLKLKAENINAGDMLLPTFQDNLLNKEPGNRHIDWPHSHQASRLLGLEGIELIHGFSPIGMEDEIQKGLFLFLLLF